MKASLPLLRKRLRSRSLRHQEKALTNVWTEVGQTSHGCMTKAPAASRLVNEGKLASQLAAWFLVRTVAFTVQGSGPSMHRR